MVRLGFPSHQIHLLNLSDISAAPQIALDAANAGNSDLPSAVRDATIDLNARLAGVASAACSTLGVDISEFDTFALFEEIDADLGPSASPTPPTTCSSPTSR